MYYEYWVNFMDCKPNSPQSPPPVQDKLDALLAKIYVRFGKALDQALNDRRNALKETDNLDDILKLNQEISCFKPLKVELLIKQRLYLNKRDGKGL